MADTAWAVANAPSSTVRFTVRVSTAYNTTLPRARARATPVTPSTRSLARRLIPCRGRRLIGRAPSLAESVAGTSNGPQHGAPDLAPQVSHIDLHGVGIGVLGRIPDVVEQLGLADDAARVPQEVLQQRVLAWSQAHGRSGELDLMGGRIESEVTQGQDRRARGHLAPDKGS